MMPRFIRKPRHRPRRSLRASAVGVPLILLAGALTALPISSASADAPTDQDPMAAAQAQAVSTGQTVPVTDLTSEISTVDANPDGSFTSTTDLLPVRVRKNGSWTPTDPTLSTNPDGTLSPAATPNSVVLSGGGTGPVATLTHADGTSMALTMPFTLPAPTLDGATAIYPAVLPGVDLSVSVTDQGGFSDVLIVHNATAAANPQLRSLTLAADTHGLTLQDDGGGGMNAVTAEGTVAYTSPRPLMWDSATTLPSAARADSITTDDTGAPASGESTSSVSGPGIDAHVEQIPMSTSDDGLTLTPDASVLTDPATQYPLFIDPYTNPVSGTAGHYDEVYSSSECNNAPQYDKPQTDGEGVGYQQWGGTCGIGLERSYYAVNTGNLHDSFKVSSAKLTIATTYGASHSCSQDQPITLHTTNAISSNTDWNSRPGTHDTAFPPVGTTVASAANPKSTCSNHTATFTVTSLIRTLASNDGDGYNAAGTFGGQANTWTIGLYGNESETSGDLDYLRMSESLTLTTTFDVAPGTPTGMKTVPLPTGAGGQCVETGDGWIGATTYSNAGSNIQLHSTVTSQISGEKVAAHYHVWDRTVTDSAGNALDKSTPASTYLASGTDAVEPIGFKLLDGHEYGWDVYAEDNSTQNLKSPISEHCWFKADFTAPPTPTIVTNPSFPPVGSTAADPVVYASPSASTNFTVSGADAAAADTTCTDTCLSSGIDHFLWSLDSAPTASSGTVADLATAAKGTATASVKINVPIHNWGVHTLYVAGVDAAGNISTAPASYTYTVPWDPDTKIAPGDITGDGVPDLLATTKTGDLDLIPGDTDPAQSAEGAQDGPVSGTPPAITGPVTVSTAADSPDGTGWNNYLIAHRGNLHGADVDDLFAYDKSSHQMYVVKNDLDPASDTAFPLVPYSTLGGFVGKRSDVVTKDLCQPSTVVPDDSRCRTTDYNSTTWNVSQLITPGNVYNNSSGYPAVITVENKELWLYQSDGGDHLKDPVLLGDGDWSGQTLIAPGNVGSNPVLWSRDNATGALYSYPLTIDPDTGLPPLLHADTHTALGLTLPPGSYPAVASPGDINSVAGGPDGLPDLYAVDTHGRLLEYPCTQGGPSTPCSFGTAQSLGTVTDTSNHSWSLAEGTGSTVSDAVSGLNASLTGSYTWYDDTARGQVLSLNGTTGYGATSSSAVDTSKSYTVSAWVELSSLAENSTFVSQSDASGNANAMQLYYSSGKQVWAFDRRDDDSTTGNAFTAVYSTIHASAGKWTHLVGVYDASAKTLSLYVNGSLAGATDYGGQAWNAAGPLQIGRRISEGTYGEYANGRVSEIRTYPAALPLADAVNMGVSPEVTGLN